MRAVRFLMVGLCLLSVLACSGGSSDSGAAQYTGEQVETSTDESGNVSIQSDSGNLFNIAVTNEDGASAGIMDITYNEDGGSAVLVITDPEGNYGRVVMIGTPEELSGKSLSRAVYGLNITVKPVNRNPIGFSENSYNLSSVYVSPTSRAVMTNSSGCYTPNALVNYFKSNYSTAFSDGWSILMFEGNISDGTASSLMYGTYLQENAAYKMYASLKTRMEYLYGEEQGALDSEEFYLSCWYPSANIGFNTVCEVTRGRSDCNIPVTGEPDDNGTPEEPENTKPFIGGNPYTSVTAGNGYSFYPAAYDADGDALTWSISNKPDWADFDTATGALTGTPAEADAGSYRQIIIGVSDGENASYLNAFDIDVYVYNSPPVIMGTPQTVITADTAYSFYPSPYDADGDALTWSISNKPDWADFDTATGALTGTPAEADAGTYTDIIISVSDGEETSPLDAFSITVNEYNSAPVIGGTPYTTITADNAYSFYPFAYDADGDALTWSISGKPGWASFSTATGALTGTPAEAQAGTYSNIIISVSDGQETSPLSAFSITVNEYNSAPVIQGTAYTTVTADNGYSFYPTAYDADGDTLTWSISGKPYWASFSTSTGALTGTPAESDAGIYTNIIISVSDGEETSPLNAFSITVNEYNSAPVIQGTPYATVTSGRPYSFYPTVYDADGDTLTWSISGKPYWLSFSTSTGALTGTPARSDAGTYSGIIISASDGDETVSLDAFDIAVSINNSAPYIGGAAAAEAMKGVTYSYTPGSYDADGDTLSYSIENGYGWLSINAATGELTGDPVTAGAGTYNVIISVSDDYAASTMNISIYVPQVLYHNGMIWQDNAEVSDVRRTWEDAIEYCEDLELDGYKGWHLPTLDELWEIAGHLLPLLSGFEYSFALPYWTSTTCASDPSQAWSIFFDFHSALNYDKTNHYYVRCVR